VAVPYNQNVGFTQEFDKGCREMASVRISPDGASKAVWASVGGKDGCDNGKFDTGSAKGGDYGVLMEVLDKGSRQGVKWVPNSGVQSRDQLPRDLADEKGKLQRPFAAYDTTRNRIVFGQGTFDDAFEQESQEKVYAATFQGSRVNVKELRVGGTQPGRRFSSCAAYVKDDDQGLDGLLVLGGESVAEGSKKEVWWIDYSGGPNGEWVDITGLFGNMDDFGYRRGGACSYNPATKHFYSWMGRANASIPDGNKRSSGVWRTDLSGLADAVANSSASLTWERLAKDNQAEISGRRLIPSVYSWKHNMIFALGGRNDLDEYSDAWVIAPGLTGESCASWNPYAAFAPPPTSTPAPTAIPPTPDPNQPTAEPNPPTPTPVNPGEGITVCSQAEGKVPGAARNAAAANPQAVAGYDTPCNPNVAYNPITNPLRKSLGLRNPNLPYHPIYNGLILKCGCP
jgi:hypothetical protein